MAQTGDKGAHCICGGMNPPADESHPAETPGAGAAGGLGYGLMTFCKANLESGFHCIATALGAEEKIAAADLVVTAEGSLDAQTLEGKTPHGVSQLARKHSKPVYAPMTLEEAIANAPDLLEKAAARLAHTIRSVKGC